MQQGLDYLLKVESDLGRIGHWVPTRNTKVMHKQDHYTQYHASYCAVAGLVKCAFEEVSLPQSSIFFNLQTAG